MESNSSFKTLTKSRIRNLTTRYLELYRYGFIFIVSLFVGYLVYKSIQGFRGTGNFSVVFTVATWGYIVYAWLKAHANVYRVEFDDDYLYIIRKSQDILIPLENIKDVELKTLGGMWRVDLYYTDVIGNHFYFKPSLLYPLNAKSKDELVNVLWRKIEGAKSRKHEFQRNMLQS